MGVTGEERAERLAEKLERRRHAAFAHGFWRRLRFRLGLRFRLRFGFRLLHRRAFL